MYSEVSFSALGVLKMYSKNVFCVFRWYTKKPCCVLQIIQLNFKNVRRSSTFLFVLREHVPRSSLYHRGTPKKCTVFFSLPSRYTENPFCVLQPINLYSKNIFCVLQQINLYSKNVYSVLQLVNWYFNNMVCLLQRTSKYMVEV